MKTELEKLSDQYGLQLIPPAPANLREEAFLALEMPEPLQQLYNVTNGITHEWFRIPPISDPDRIKKTWNSIQRINAPSTSKYLADATRFLQRFLVFAELSGPDYGVFDRERGTIWYSEGDDLHETDLDLIAFISNTLSEVEELLNRKKSSKPGPAPQPLQGASYVLNLFKKMAGLVKIKKKNVQALQALSGNMSVDLGS